MRISTPGWLAGLAALALSSSAPAMTFDPNPVPVSHFGGTVAGEVELIGVVTGLPSGGVVLYGSTSPTATTLVLQGRVTAGPSGILYLGVLEAGSGGTWVDLAGLGWIAGPDEDISTALEGIPGTAGFLSTNPVAAGGSFDRVFISYDAPLAFDGSLEFIASLVQVPEEVGTALLVPEPAAGWIALAAMLGLATRARRR